MSDGTQVCTAEDVVWLLDVAHSQGIRIWLDGGWAVDALLGKQTRPHGDVDIWVSMSDAPVLTDQLRQAGLTLVPTDDQRECNFVMAGDGRRVDFHVYDQNKTLGGPEGGSVTYNNGADVIPGHCFSGRGVVAGRPVNCIEPRTLVEWHTGYPHDADDLHDVTLLCAEYGIKIPEQYWS